MSYKKKKELFKENKTAKDKFNYLRKQAEELIGPAHSTHEPMSTNDPLKLIRELETFQIELELQNEELYRSGQKLMRSQIRYTELYDNAPVGYISLDSKGLILNANLTFSDMVMSERSGLLNRSLADYIEYEDQDILYNHLKNLSNLKTRQDCELRLRKRDGTLSNVQFESEPIPDEKNQSEKFRTAVIDIEKRKQLEEERQRLEASLRHAHKMKSIFTIAGGVAHDFNNILQAIIGNAELAIENTPERDYAYSHLKAIHTSAIKAAGIVKRLLNFSRKTDKVQEPVSVDVIITEIYNLLRSSLPATIEIRTNPTNKAVILADKNQICQILMNLCTNAAQVMGETGGIIEINTEVKTLIQENAESVIGLKQGEYVKIKVSDTGPGIDSEIIDRIFDPYFTTGKFGVTPGMGLAVVYGIVNNHGGAVTVESKKGEGATFNIFLPLIKMQVTPEEKTQSEMIDLIGNERILFVDDDEFIIDIAQNMLETSGYHVDVFLSPVEALEQFQINPNDYDIVITDMTMPKMTGLSLFEKIKSVRADIPVVICTGYSASINEEKAKLLGFDSYLMKPVSMSEITETVRKVLEP